MTSKHYTRLDFLIDMFGNSKNAYMVFGEDLVARLDERRNVHIKLANGGTVDKYTQVIVEIYDKFNGLLIRRNFEFCLFFKEKDRIDDRQHDHPSNFHVWEEGNSSSKKTRWYIAQPSNESIEKFIEQIETFIEIYK